MTLDLRGEAYAASRISSTLKGSTNNSDGCRPSQPKLLRFQLLPQTLQPSEFVCRSVRSRKLRPKTLSVMKAFKRELGSCSLDCFSACAKVDSRPLCPNRIIGPLRQVSNLAQGSDHCTYSAEALRVLSDMRPQVLQGCNETGCDTGHPQPARHEDLE
jgi:hypothetical protein